MLIILAIVALYVAAFVLLIVTLFGGLLGMAHECANREKTLHSYELWARYVAPQFQGSAVSTCASREWVGESGERS